MLTKTASVSSNNPPIKLLTASRANSFNHLTFADDDTSQLDNGSSRTACTEPRVVHIVVEFMRMGEIDTLNEKFHAELFIESKWLETENIGPEYDPKKHWNPRLYIENIYQEPKESIRYEMSRDTNNNILITEKRVVKGSFWERLELQNFPVDVQELSISLASKLPPNEVRLEEDSKLKSFMNLEAASVFSDQQKCFVDVRHSASYDTELSSSNINIVNDSLSSSLTLYKKMEVPKLVATCYCSRRAGYYFFNAYSLIFLITISSLTIFSVDCKMPQSRLQTTYTILLTSVSFKWVINRQLPTVSYLTSLDKYAIGSIFYVCLLCVWHSVVGSFWSQELARELDFWSLIGFSIFFVLIHVALFIWFFVAYSEVRKLNRREHVFLAKLYKRSEDLFGSRRTRSTRFNRRSTTKL